MYQAGGDPKAAQKRVEADAAKASNELKSSLPGSGKEVKKDAEVVGQDVKSSVQNAAKDARKKIDSTDVKLDEYRREAEMNASAAAQRVEGKLKEGVDKFDKNVTEVSCFVNGAV